MKTILWGILAWALAPGLGASALRDWADFKPGENLGIWADAAGTTLSVSQVAGPTIGSKALRIEAKLVQWGGVWASAQAALPAEGGLRFQAKSEGPMQLVVSLGDDRKVGVQHVVRLKGGIWETFTLPADSFQKSPWQDPAAAKGAFDADKIVSLNLSPQGAGRCAVSVGMLELLGSKPALKDGMMNPDVVQDFLGLESSAFGPWADTVGSAIAMTVTSGAPKTGEPAARFIYSRVDGGWCGEWIRAGADWSGQDWSKAKAIVMEAYSADPLQLLFTFNDANQNSYQSAELSLKAGSWQTLEMPIGWFKLSDSQPAQAKAGAALDLSRMGAFNISPLTEGKHTFWIRVVRMKV